MTRRLAKTPRYFYVGNFFSDRVKQQREISTDSPAATGKVARICKAARDAGGDVWIISLGRGRTRGTGRRYGATAGRIGGGPALYLPFNDKPVLTHLDSILSLLTLVLRCTDRRSVLVFYNFTFHYLLALVVSRILGRRCILDIEDGFRTDDRSLRASANLFLLKTYNLFCNGGAMLASRALGEQSPLRASYVCYGVSEVHQTPRQWSGPLQVLLGGSLLVDTGAELFVEALRLLRDIRPQALHRLKFVVTGFGDRAELIERLAGEEMGEFLQFHGKVTGAQYREILRGSHLGLCLKLPSSSMGATTFPSKVVELASHGLLVVSTRVSDVPLLFDESTALLLDEATPAALVSALLCVVDDPERFHGVALAGQGRVAATLSAERVGAEVMRFWQGELPVQNSASPLGDGC